MAGDWMALRLDIHDDPAVIYISNALGIEIDMVVGKLTRLWSWANKQLADGTARLVTSEWIDRYVSAAGFAAAMAETGWLQIRSGGIHFPSFDVWNSAGAKRRLLDSKRKTAKRASENTPDNVRRLSASHADKNRTKEEKRREENKNPPLPPEGQGEIPESEDADRPRRQYDVGKALILPPVVQEAMRSYTPDVQRSAWEVLQMFTRFSPGQRSLSKLGEMAAVFADVLCHRPEARHRFNEYFSISDPREIEKLVTQGSRLPPRASPWEICSFLFPPAKNHQGPSGPTKCNALEREKQKIAEAKANPVTPAQFAEIRRKAVALAQEKAAEMAQARRPA